MDVMGPYKSPICGGAVYPSRFDAVSVGARRLPCFGFSLAWLLLAGCSNYQFPVATITESSSISGAVHGGQQPITGATIQLYAAGTSGDGSAATPLITASVTTNSSGSFDLTGLYKCPTSASEVYLMATGGNPGLANGETNPQIALMTALGPCGSLTTATTVEINEVTTVAATYALAPYMQSYIAIGSNPGDAQMVADAFTMAAELSNTGTGGTPGIGVPTGQVVPSQKLNTLADILSSCINSSGGKAGDSSSCGLLFSLVPAASSGLPTDTVGALLDLAQNPTSNVAPLFDLDPPTKPFQPSLTAAPADWTLGITSPTPSPAFSPSPGTYVALPSVTLFESGPSAAIYYTTDGSRPTSFSNPYTGAFALLGTTTIRAVAIASGVSSLFAAGTYTLQVPTLSLNATSIPFGNVVVNTTSTQEVTLTSTGTGAVTVNAATVTGAGYTMSGVAFPVTLNPTQAVTLNVMFDPAVTGLASGQLTVTSNSSTNSTAVIALSGTGLAGTYAVDLSWDAPSSSADPVAGYNIYRAPSGSSTYLLLNSMADTATTYVDSTVQDGLIYDYIVESVDASGVESIASNMMAVTIP
jgi:hypothetical protein